MQILVYERAYVARRDRVGEPIGAGLGRQQEVLDRLLGARQGWLHVTEIQQPIAPFMPNSWAYEGGKAVARPRRDVRVVHLAEDPVKRTATAPLCIFVQQALGMFDQLTTATCPSMVGRDDEVLNHSGVRFDEVVGDGTADRRVTVEHNHHMIVIFPVPPGLLAL